MPKNIPPQNGCRAADLLGMRPPEMFKGSPKSRMKTIDLITKELRLCVNEASCLSGIQGYFVEKEIVELAKMLRINQLIPTSPLSQYPTEDLTDLMNTKCPELSDRFHRIVQMINSFHLDCINCLNADCDYRDSDYPVEEVQRRVDLPNAK